MNIPSLSDTGYRRELGAGLVLRWSAPSDVEELVRLYGTVFRDKASDPINARMGYWVRDLMSGQHPLCGPNDFAVVEDTERGMLVAATCLMSQTWNYDGVAVPVGRPEIVATEEEYRNRGLIRAIFELIHARSAAQGQMAIGITGIPYYYRQFGYEYALDLGGGRTLPFSAIPKLKEGESEAFLLREATREDLPRALELYRREHERAAISTEIDPGYWQYVLEEMNVESGEGWRTQLIVDAQAEGQPVCGYVLHRHRRSGDTMIVLNLAVDAGVPLARVMPSVLRGLQTIGAGLRVWNETQTPPPETSKIYFGLGREHPVYNLFDPTLTPAKPRPYSWYVRVPDVAGFIRHVAPVLERRLAASVQDGYTGDLKITTYRGGLWLKFEQGRLTGAEPWQDTVLDSQAMAGFPPLVFLQLLFGHRSLEELRFAFADIWVNDTARTLLEALFPPRLARVLPLD
ncbi:MAG: hypothetical protein OHK0022_60910 [Roseiflexaceae bacterium]